MAGPMCPKCNIAGIENIYSEESKKESKGGDAWFEVVYCANCGHIYGVFAKHVLTHHVALPTPGIDFQLPGF